MTQYVTHIGTDVDKLGDTVDLFHLQRIGGHPVEQMYIDQYNELVQKGFAEPMTYTNNIGSYSAVYAVKNNKTLGFIIFTIVPNAKLLWNYMSHTFPEYKNTGIFQIVRSHMDKIAKKANITSAAAHVHVDHHAHLEIAERLGSKKVYYYIKRPIE